MVIREYERQFQITGLKRIYRTTTKTSGCSETKKCRRLKWLCGVTEHDMESEMQAPILTSRMAGALASGAKCKRVTKKLTDQDNEYFNAIFSKSKLIPKNT